MRMVFERYGLEKHYESYADAATLLLRFLKYKKPTDVQSNINPIAHTDKSFISFLHQNDVRGLEVMTKDGEWFTFEPSPSTFMIMAGDAFMVSVVPSNSVDLSVLLNVKISEREMKFRYGLVSAIQPFVLPGCKIIDEED